MSNRFQSARLSAMMFLQFFVWGAWYVTVGNFMVAEGMGDITHWAYTVGPLAAILSPFFLGMISDRYFDVEKVLGVLHLLGGGTLLIAPMFSSSPTTFIVVIGVHMLCYTPTLGLSNSLAFHNITSQEKQFPLIDRLVLDKRKRGNLIPGRFRYFPVEYDRPGQSLYLDRDLRGLLPCILCRCVGRGPKEEECQERCANGRKPV